MGKIPVFKLWGRNTYYMLNYWKQDLIVLLFIFTIRKRSCRKVMFSQACVKKSVHGGVCIPSCTGADTPLGRHPPRQTPPGQTPPSRRLLQRTVRILLECIVIVTVFTYILGPLVMAKGPKRTIINLCMAVPFSIWLNFSSQPPGPQRVLIPDGCRNLFMNLKTFLLTFFHDKRNEVFFWKIKIFSVRGR